MYRRVLARPHRRHPKPSGGARTRDSRSSEHVPRWPRSTTAPIQPCRLDRPHLKSSSRTRRERQSLSVAPRKGLHAKPVASPERAAHPHLRHPGARALMPLCGGVDTNAPVSTTSVPEGTRSTCLAHRLNCFGRLATACVSGNSTSRHLAVSMRPRAPYPVTRTRAGRLCALDEPTAGGCCCSPLRAHSLPESTRHWDASLRAPPAG